MFRLRLLTTILLLPIAIAGILFLPSKYIAVISGALIMIAAWEWLQMSVAKTVKIRLLLLSALALVAYSLLIAGLQPMWMYYFALLWWLCALIGVCYYPNGKGIWKQISLQPLIGIVMFVPSWLAFNMLNAQVTFGPVWVLLGCALIWGADIGAYCAGKLWGKTKLIQEVSPGKTWAGLYGGLATGCLIMLVFYFWYKPDFNLIYAMWLAIITVIFAVIGDLYESMTKRIYGVKDSGKIIPGHGGMYDRIDSMLSAFPIYFLGLQILNNLHIMAL